MNYAVKTVPNQKVVSMEKESCKGALFAQINMEALESAARDLDAGAFKLWVYFAKNQNSYTFALSSKDVENTFGMKIKQYNNAIATLTEKGYLVETSKNHYTFKEIAVMPKEDNEVKQENSVISFEDNSVMTKSNNVVMPFQDNQLYQKDIRNITDNTFNITINNTTTNNLPGAEELTREQVLEEFGLSAVAARVPTNLPNTFWIGQKLIKII